MSKCFELPACMFVPIDEVHTAKSWNPGKGHDTTGTGGKDGKPGKPKKN